MQSFWPYLVIQMLNQACCKQIRALRAKQMCHMDITRCLKSLLMWQQHGVYHGVKIVGCWQLHRETCKRPICNDWMCTMPPVKRLPIVPLTYSDAADTYIQTVLVLAVKQRFLPISPISLNKTKKNTGTDCALALHCTFTQHKDVLCPHTAGRCL